MDQLGGQWIVCNANGATPEDLGPKAMRHRHSRHIEYESKWAARPLIQRAN